MDAGLGAMTGVLPVVVVAGAATKMTQSMFDGQRRRPARKASKRRSPQYSAFSGGMASGMKAGRGNFSNIGL